jgi:hypothetical protein
VLLSGERLDNVNSISARCGERQTLQQETRLGRSGWTSSPGLTLSLAVQFRG